MQTCSECNAQSSDAEKFCIHCGSDLSTLSTTMVTLKRFQENTRVKNIRVVVSDDACPACREFERTYDKESVPNLPVNGCSHDLGCRCFYEPTLNSLYP